MHFAFQANIGIEADNADHAWDIFKDMTGLDIDQKGRVEIVIWD